MATKKILITGMRVGATEQDIRALLDRFGPVERVDIICQGSPEAPVALVEMDLRDSQLASLIQRLTGYWHDGAVLSAHLLAH